MTWCLWATQILEPVEGGTGRRDIEHQVGEGTPAAYYRSTTCAVMQMLPQSTTSSHAHRPLSRVTAELVMKCQLSIESHEDTRCTHNIIHLIPNFDICLGVPSYLKLTLGHLGTYTFCPVVLPVASRGLKSAAHSLFSTSLEV